jgi:ribosomal protein L32E
MPKKNFLRRTWNRYAKLGKGRKKKQKWRNPTGRDNKLREKVKSKGPVVSIGYKSDGKVRGQIKKKTPVQIFNVYDLEKVGKHQIGIVGNIGLKKKIEIAQAAKEKKVEIANLNVKSFLKKNKIKKKKIEKTKKEIKQEKKKVKEGKK